MSSLLGRIFGRSPSRVPRPTRPPPYPGPQRSRSYSPDDTATWTFPHRPVASSNLASVAYDFDSQTMEVRFREASRNTTGACRYSGVPLAVYRDLMDAPSKGRFHWRAIRNQYPFRYV